MKDESKTPATTSATVRTVVVLPETEDGDHFEVEISPTKFSRKGGYDFSLRKQSHAWATSELSLRHLAAMRDALTSFIDERNPELNS